MPSWQNGELCSFQMAKLSPWLRDLAIMASTASHANKGIVMMMFLRSHQMNRISMGIHVMPVCCLSISNGRNSVDNREPTSDKCPDRYCGTDADISQATPF